MKKKWNFPFPLRPLPVTLIKSVCLLLPAEVQKVGILVSKILNISAIKSKHFQIVYINIQIFGKKKLVTVFLVILDRHMVLGQVGTLGKTWNPPTLFGSVS